MTKFILPFALAVLGFGSAALASSLAPATPVTQISCSAFINGSRVEVIKIQRIQANGDSSFQATYFFKKLVNSPFCMADASKRPENIRCVNLNSLDPSLTITISSSDGVLNIGKMTYNGTKTNLYCGAR